MSPSENETPENNQSNKISFFKKITDNFSNIVIPNECLSIDERLCKFKGRFRSKVYMPLKPDKWGLKVILLCDSNGLAIRPYYVLKGLSIIQIDNIVMELLQGYMNWNHKLFIDSYYCHPALLEKLQDLHFYANGTVRHNRKDIPHIIKNKKTKKGEIFYFSKGNVSAIKCQEKKSLSL